MLYPSLRHMDGNIILFKKSGFKARKRKYLNEDSEVVRQARKNAFIKGDANSLFEVFFLSS